MENSKDRLNGLTDEQIVRLGRIERTLGRPVRVLLLGNIANNAFHHAKLLRKIGVEADVACPDYYHIMGCPEWEDADFDNQITDDFNPNWTGIDLGTYERPRWFVQGPWRLVTDHLASRNGGSRQKSEITWRLLATYNKTNESRIVDRLLAALWKVNEVSFRVKRALKNPAHLELSLHRIQNDFYHRESRLAAKGVNLVRPLILLIARIVSRGSVQPSELLNQLEPLIEKYNDRFPERPDKLTYEDITPYLFEIPFWRGVFSHYDIIQAFATSPIIPMLAGTEYFAFEHGTLRDIPDVADARGRLTALSYSAAEHVFVTNSDCWEKARALAGNRCTFINHPYDEEDTNVGGVFDTRTVLLEELNSNYLIFHPTRHDWVVGDGTADKANDMLIRAVARLRTTGLRVGLILCSWGNNVKASQQLVLQLGLDGFVRWEQPMAGRQFLRTCKACDVVADQFLLGAFGGITFKAMAAGAVICTRLNGELAKASFGSSPPVIACDTEDDIVSNLANLFDEPERLTELRRASKRWISEFHSGKQVLSAHLDKYLDYIEEITLEV